MDQNTKDVLMIFIPTAASIATALIALRTKTRVETVADDVLKIEKATNSHATMLNEALKAVAKSEGKQEERVERRERDAVAASLPADSAIPPIVPPPAAD